MEDIIQSIMKAEKEAAQIKSDAQVKAAQILESAQAEAQTLEQTAAEENKTYRETQLNAARVQADKEYEFTLREKENDARAYCENALLESGVAVGEIIGRIVRGDY